MGARLVTQLIDAVLIMAIRRCKLPISVIPHSDRSSQYCSDVYQALLKQHDFMSGKGDCYDNAVMESFYHMLKMELIYGKKYKTREETQLLVFDYIKVFYNRQHFTQLWDIRRQMSLG